MQTVFGWSLWSQNSGNKSLPYFNGKGCISPVLWSIMTLATDHMYPIVSYINIAIRAGNWNGSHFVTCDPRSHILLHRHAAHNFTLNSSLFMTH